MNRQIKSLLSIARGGGFLKSGELSVENLIKSKNGKLILIAKDASENTKKKFKNKSFFYKIPVFEFSTMEELSMSIGQIKVAVIGISNDGIACKLNDLIHNELKDENVIAKEE